MEAMELHIMKARHMVWVGQKTERMLYMLKRILVLLFGMLLVFSFVLAEDGSGDSRIPDTEEAAATGSDVPDYMTPEQFASMFNALFSTSGDILRSRLGDEEVDRLISTYSLTQYEVDGPFMYYGSTDWLIEAAFVFLNEEDTSPEAPSYLWSLYLMDAAEENAWYLGMYTLKMMIAYTYRNVLDEKVFQRWFETVVPGSVLELPDGYTLKVFRMEDCAVFTMAPPSGDIPYGIEENGDGTQAGDD